MHDSILAVKKPGWFELRFVENHKKVHSNCAVCGRSMWLPKSKSAKYVTCGGACAEARYSASGNQERHKPKEVKPLRLWECKECKKEHVGGKARSIFCGSDCRIAFQEKSKQALIAERSRSCVHCAAVFVAKKSQIDDGHGKYCSRQCARDAGAFAHITSAENLAKATMARRKSVEKNGTKHKRGEESPQWRGGRSAAEERRREKSRSPEGRERLRAYRAANKEKVHEFRMRRRGRAYGRLPAGTVAKIGQLQKWLCAVCRCGVKDGYHVDHIVPLAKGGQHIASNIQILCPTCNVRKSAKDPIDFMQSRGFLL
jgi:5-methylcytosine-specific restriction endonuclease McrA